MESKYDIAIKDMIRIEKSSEHELCELVHKNFGKFSSIPNVLKTQQVCLVAVQVYGGNIRHVPEDKKTKELCMTAVERYGCALDCVPINLRDYELCTLAVKNNGWAIRYVPVEIMDKKMILLAVNHIGNIIQIIPKEKIDVDVCVEFLGNLGDYVRYGNYYMEQFVPKDLREEVEKKLEVFNFDKYYNLVKEDTQNIEYTPKHMIPIILEKLENKVPSNFNFNSCHGCVFNGKQFNQLIGDRELFKFTNKDEEHRGMKYKTGENKDILKFNPAGECSMGGLYFTEGKHEHTWIIDNVWRRRVSLANDALIYVEQDKFKADKIILGERELILFNQFT